MRFAPFVGLSLALGGIACGGDGSTAPRASGVGFIAGNRQTDTVQADLARALIVQIAPHDGQSAAGQIVEFRSILLDTAPPGVIGPAYEAYVGSLLSPLVESVLVDTTDAQGKAYASIFLGFRTGRARVEVTVPAFGYADTATFTVKAGNAAAITVTPADTALFIGGQAILHAAATDRFGNARSDPVTFSIISGPASVSGSTVTATGVGRVSIASASGTFRDTSFVSVVPKGLIAGAVDDSGGIAMFNLDGSGYRIITPTLAGTVKWAPSGTSVVFDQVPGGLDGGSNQLASATLDGTVSVLDKALASQIDAWPAYRRDGSLIYYWKSNALWQVHPNSTGDAAVQPFPSLPNGFTFPSPSPNGQQLSYVAAGGNHIHILTLASQTDFEIGVNAEAAQWSPKSDLIAYASDAFHIGIVHTDGSGQTVLTPTSIYGAQFDWSPDGQFIIARNAVTNRLDLISVSTAEILPLAYTGKIGSPTWH